MSTLDRIADRLERASGLDGTAAKVASAVQKVLRPGPVKDVLSGTPVGHPVHPLLVTVPIGAWTSVHVLDALGERDAATALTGVGVLAALPTATTGLSDWSDTLGAEQRVGLVHAAVNDTAIALYGASWLARRRGRHGLGIGLSLVGAAFLSVGGWLGGHLSYAQGVGVDTTAFEQVPTEWTDAGDAASVPEAGTTQVSVNGVAVLLASVDGTLRAIADRCTHRGGPLSDGPVEDGCVTCPWHGSVFDLRDGEVVRGPATRPQPTLEVRVREGRVEVRRDEPRTLRTNPA